MVAESEIRVWITLYVNGQIYSQNRYLFVNNETPKVSDVNVDSARQELRVYVSWLLRYEPTTWGSWADLLKLFVGENARISANGYIKSYPCFYRIPEGWLGFEKKKFAGEIMFVSENSNLVFE